jgi:DNA-binding NarL/FixJ family response regulator
MSVRVLLVAAHEEAASLAQRLSRSSEIDLVGTVRGASEARNLAAQRPDLILVDLGEGDDSERELCRELASVFPSPLVVLTSFMTRENWKELQAAGVSNYLLRHVDTRRLAEELSRLAAPADGPNPLPARDQPRGPGVREGNDERSTHSGGA